MGKTMPNGQARAWTLQVGTSNGERAVACEECPGPVACGGQSLLAQVGVRPR